MHRVSKPTKCPRIIQRQGRPKSSGIEPSIWVRKSLVLLGEAVADASFPTWSCLSASPSGEPSAARPPTPANQCRRVHVTDRQSTRPRLPPLRFGLWFSRCSTQPKVPLGASHYFVVRRPLRRYAAVARPAPYDPCRAVVARGARPVTPR